MCFDLEHKTKNCFITVFLTFSFPTKKQDKWVCVRRQSHRTFYDQNAWCRLGACLINCCNLKHFNCGYWLISHCLLPWPDSQKTFWLILLKYFCALKNENNVFQCWWSPRSRHKQHNIYCEWRPLIGWLSSLLASDWLRLTIFTIFTPEWLFTRGEWLWLGPEPDYSL